MDRREVGGVIPVYIGYDSEQGDAAYRVCRESILDHASEPVHITRLDLDWLSRIGLYTRPYFRTGDQKYDGLDGKPFSTEFSFSRFLVPSLQPEGWAIFCDSDFLFLDDIAKLWALRDDQYAAMCVKHDYHPDEGVKMRGQRQVCYFRKNWSSLVMWNCDHPLAHVLTPLLANIKKGSYLHGFQWLEDYHIGAIPEAWNWLDGHSSEDIKPSAVHFTRGTPDMEGWGNTKYAGHWLRYWAREAA